MKKLTAPAPTLVAHRGYSGRYPENTLLAYKKAYKSGAREMELDLQLTKNLVPVLHHDMSLQRMASVDLDVRDIEVKQFKRLYASYADRFDNKFSKNKFTTFNKFCKWLNKHKDVTIYVEIKQESIDSYGISKFLDEVYKRILKNKVVDQCVIISFNHQVIEYAREISVMRCGWVLPEWSTENRVILERLNPEFLFCDKDYLPDSDAQIWQGNWQWAVYNLDDVDSAIAMANRGIPILETNQIGTLMQNTELSQGGGDVCA